MKTPPTTESTVVPTRRQRRINVLLLMLIETLVDDDPACDSPEGKLLVDLAKCCEEYEKAILPPPFGDAKPEGG